MRKGWNENGFSHFREKRKWCENEQIFVIFVTFRKLFSRKAKINFREVFAKKWKLKFSFQPYAQHFVENVLLLRLLRKHANCQAIIY
jgi:hypothetical protein